MNPPITCPKCNSSTVEECALSYRTRRLTWRSGHGYKLKGSDTSENEPVHLKCADCDHEYDSDTYDDFLQSFYTT